MGILGGAEPGDPDCRFGPATPEAKFGALPVPT
jgi:hypothetical protein